MEPSFILSLPLSSWEMMVGITALADCLGPKVLKGLTIDTGRLKLLKNDSANLSAPIFVAE